MEFSFERLLDSIPQCEYHPTAESRLTLAEAPDPFVRPTLSTDADDLETAFASDVIFVEAPAAVGKTTMARYLSAQRRAPLLDLATVGVSTHSLLGLLQLEIEGPGNPVSAFHAGQVPVLVDALDEGRLLSGEQGFESFLQTTGELLAKNREDMNRPKLIIFGRPESIALAKLGLELAAEGLKMSSAIVTYFDEQGARQLIDAYARTNSPVDGPYFHHRGPADGLIEVYFESIERALSIPQGSLWTDNHGRAFAGYAPVLAALGILLARTDSYIEVTNRLRQEGTAEAWGVIETVLQQILVRERSKLIEKLEPQVSGPIPADLYSPAEQLRLLAAYVNRQDIATVSSKELPPIDLPKYIAMVEQNLPDHPFIRHRSFGNPVLGSLAMTQAMASSELRSIGSSLLRDYSRQPFLWRFHRTRLNPKTDLLGSHLGYILNSFWNDPLTRDGRVVIRSSALEDRATVFVPSASSAAPLTEALLPLTFYSQVRDLDMDLPGDASFECQQAASGSSLFFFRGATMISCESATFDASTIVFEGSTWLESERVVVPQPCNIFVRPGAQVGWGGQFVGSYPWNRHPPTLDSPYPPPLNTKFEELVEECWRRIPAGTTMILNQDYSVTDDQRVRWIERRFSVSFPKMIGLLLENGLASTTIASASGSTKIRVRFNTTWGDIRLALQRGSSPPNSPLTRFIKSAIVEIG